MDSRKRILLRYMCKFFRPDIWKNRKTTYEYEESPTFHSKLVKGEVCCFSVYCPTLSIPWVDI